MRGSLCGLTIVAAIFTSTTSCAPHARKPVQARPAVAPPTRPVDPGYRVSDMNVQTIRGTTYLYQATRTTHDRIGEVAGRMLDAVGQAAAASRVSVGTPIFVYHDVSERMDQPFDLEIGYAVPDGTRAAGECKVRKLEAFHCAAAVCTGPMASLGKAYDTLLHQMVDGRLRPGNETREYYLYFEGPESPNDVTQIQIGIKE